MAKQEATVQAVSLPAPAARTGPDGLAEHSAPRHVDRTGLRARIGGAPAAHSGEAWRTGPYLQQAPVPTTNAAPYGRHGPAGLTVDTVRFFLTMPSGARWPLPSLPWWTVQEPGLVVGDINSWTDAADDEPPPVLGLGHGEEQGSRISVVSYMWHLATGYPDHSAASAA